MELARSCCRPKPRPWLRSIFLSVIGLCVKLWHRNKTKCSESNPVQSSRSKSTTCPRKGRMLKFESNSTATLDGSAQKLGNDVRRDSESIATKVCSQIGRKWNVMFETWKQCSDQRWQDELRFSIWRFFEQSAFANFHLLCYWPTIHNSITKICPKFQVFSSHFFEVDELLDEQWAKIVQSEKISNPIYVECDEMYRSKVCVHEFSFFVSGLDNQLEPLENNNPVRKKNLLQVSLHLLLHLSLTQAHGILRFPCLHFAAAGSLHILGSSRFEVLCTCNARSSSTWLLACPLCAFINHDCLSFPAPCSLSAAPCRQQPTADLALHTSSTLPARGSLRQASCLQKASCSGKDTGHHVLTMI